VADYTPTAGSAPEKLRKGEGDLSLGLRRTPDILAELGRMGSTGRRVLVGFAAETSDLVENATAKLRSKNVDLVVANDVSRSDAGFGVETNAATIVSESDAGEVIADDIPLGSKRALAGEILDRVERRLSATVATPSSTTTDS
jgi:phosphopantothenoylcysteine decarboxylase/phosphopantothenate--cysteine ligase